MKQSRVISFFGTITPAQGTFFMLSQLSRLFCGVYQRGEVLIMPFAGGLWMVDGLIKTSGDFTLPQIFCNARRASLVVVYGIKRTFRIHTCTETYAPGHRGYLLTAPKSFVD